MNVNNRIKSLREEFNIDQQILAQKVNLNKSVMNRIELGTRPIRDEELIKFAEIFNVSVDYLLCRTNTRNFNDNNTSVDKEELSLIDDYKKLNSIGKKEAEKRVKELTLIPFYVEEKVVSLAAHNDHLDDPDEKEKILDDFNNMDKW